MSNSIERGGSSGHVSGAPNQDAARQNEAVEKDIRAARFRAALNQSDREQAEKAGSRQGAFQNAQENIQKAVQKPAEKPGEKPGEKTGQKPGDKPGGLQAGNPGQGGSPAQAGGKPGAGGSAGATTGGKDDRPEAGGIKPGLAADLGEDLALISAGLAAPPGVLGRKGKQGMGAGADGGGAGAGGDDFGGLGAGGVDGPGATRGGKDSKTLSKSEEAMVEVAAAVSAAAAQQPQAWTRPEGPQQQARRVRELPDFEGIDPIHQLLIGKGPQGSEAKMIISVGPLAGTQIHLREGPGGLQAAIMTQNESARQTLSSAMQAVADKLKLKGHNLDVRFNGNVPAPGSQAMAGQQRSDGNRPRQ